MGQKSKIITSIILITVVVATTFLPAIFNDFVGWDDPQLVTENEVIKELTLNNLKKMFLGNFLGHYCPLVILSFALEYRYFGADPFYYHFDNLILHIVITLLVFWFIYLLSGSLIAAFVTGIMFGVHPLHVESVAWVTERKDLVYSVFYIFSLISYVYYLKKEKLGYYFLCVFLVLLSFFSKIMTVSIPLVIILLDYYYGRKISIRSILEKSVLFLMAAAFGVVNLAMEIHIGATKISGDMLYKSYFIAKVIPFYLGKIIAPIDLSALYSYYNITHQNLGEIKYYLLLLLMLIALIFYSIRYTKKVVFGGFFFLFTILPVLQIVPAGQVFAADRYMYMPSIGLFFIMGTFFAYVAGTRIGRLRFVRLIAVAAFGVLIAWYSARTWHRCFVWRNTESLFLDVVAKQRIVTPAPYLNLGVYYEKNGDLDKSEYYYRKTLEVIPNSKEVKENLRRVLKKKKIVQSRL